MIFSQLEEQLNSLVGLLQAIDNVAYNTKIKHLGNSTIGGHTRHIIEMLQCNLKAYEMEKVDYLNRVRNMKLETDISSAIEVINELKRDIALPDKPLLIEVEHLEAQESKVVYTSYYREIIYGTEHTIHHLALIKVALIDLGLNLVDETFGIAYSTIKYREALEINASQKN